MNEIYLLRQQLKFLIARERGIACEVCRYYDKNPHPAVGSHLHEGLVTRKDFQGLPKDKRGAIFVKYNCFLVCAEHHLNKALPPREWFWERAVAYYGKDVVEEWYNSLPFKSLMRRLG